MKKITVKAVRKFDPCFDPIELDGIQDNSKMTLGLGVWTMLIRYGLHLDL